MGSVRRHAQRTVAVCALAAALSAAAAGPAAANYPPLPSPLTPAFIQQDDPNPVVIPAGGVGSLHLAFGGGYGGDTVRVVAPTGTEFTGVDPQRCPQATPTVYECVFVGPPTPDLELMLRATDPAAVPSGGTARVTVHGAYGVLDDSPTIALNVVFGPPAVAVPMISPQVGAVAGAALAVPGVLRAARRRRRRTPRVA